MKTEKGSVAVDLFISARPATMREIDAGDITLPWLYLRGNMVFEFHNHENAYLDKDEYVWIGQCKVECPLPSGVDITELMLQQLKEEKELEIAKHYLRVEKIDQKIQSLRALEHKPTLVAAD